MGIPWRRAGVSAGFLALVLACSPPVTEKVSDDFQPVLDEEVTTGELADGDDVLQSGELVDEYPLEGEVGRYVRLRLSSRQFDTYLILVDPEGRQLENDDDEVGDSSIETRLESPGEHRILVTSFEPGETGRYS